MRALLAVLVVLGLCSAAMAAGTATRDARAWRKATYDCVHYQGCAHLRRDWKIDLSHGRCTAYSFHFDTARQGRHGTGFILCG